MIFNHTIIKKKSTKTKLVFYFTVYYFFFFFALFGSFLTRHKLWAIINSNQIIAASTFLGKKARVLELAYTRCVNQSIPHLGFIASVKDTHAHVLFVKLPDPSVQGLQ